LEIGREVGTLPA